MDSKSHDTTVLRPHCQGDAESCAVCTARPYHFVINTTGPHCTVHIIIIIIIITFIGVTGEAYIQKADKLELTQKLRIESRYQLEQTL